MGRLKMNKIFVLSRYKEDFSWVEEYTQEYLIYNKGEPILANPRIENTENIGGNQRDIFKFAYENYDNLPDIMVFCQAFPFDHCKKDVFDKLVQNTEFTPLEYYGNIPANGWEGRTENFKFLERNNSWYIGAHNTSNNQSCRYSSFDEFMNTYFENYQHVDWIRFSPGSQYIVEKANIKKYPKNFWFSLMNELNTKTPTEGHIIERALYYILTNTYKLKNVYL
jgi:hypothetical protein